MAGRSKDRNGGTGRPKKKKTGEAGGAVPKHGPGGDSRAKKIEIIKEDYVNGRYVVRPEKVAGKMVDDEVRRIRSRRG